MPSFSLRIEAKIFSSFLRKANSTYQDSENVFKNKKHISGNFPE